MKLKLFTLALWSDDTLVCVDRLLRTISKGKNWLMHDWSIKDNWFYFLKGLFASIYFVMPWWKPITWYFHSLLCTISHGTAHIHNIPRYMTHDDCKWFHLDFLPSLSPMNINHEYKCCKYSGFNVPLYLVKPFLQQLLQPFNIHYCKMHGTVIQDTCSGNSKWNKGRHFFLVEEKKPSLIAVRKRNT